MIRQILSSAVVAAFALSSVQAQAAGPSQSFTVSATLNAKCETRHTTDPNMDFGAYDAFQSSDITRTIGINFRCSRHLGATAALDVSTGTIMGVGYSLALDTPTPVDTTTGDGMLGAFRSYSYTVTGTMQGKQAGDATGAAGPNTHTVTVSF